MDLNLFQLIILGVFGILFFLYVWLQFFSLKLENAHLFVISLLFLQALAGFSIAWMAVNGRINLFVGLPFAIGVWSIFSLAVAIIKMLFLGNLRVIPPKTIMRQRLQIIKNHTKFIVTTKDQIKISGFLMRGNHSKAIIISHGGFGSKNTMVSLSLAHWLSYDFDVFSFDTRGHFESHGNWTADGKTKYDLLAVIDYAKKLGYERIGVLGHSLGGWTALLLGIEKKFDSLVAIAAPLGHIRETPRVARLEKLKSPLGRFLVRVFIGFRYRDYNDSETLTPRECSQDIQVPTFLIYGKKDTTTGLTEEEIRSFYNEVATMKELHIFPEIGHIPFLWQLGPIYLMIRDWFLKTMQ